MFTPGKYNITVIKGADFSLPFTITVGDEVLDLTNCIVQSEIRARQARDSKLLATFTCLVDGVAVPNPAPTNNVIRLTLTETQTGEIKNFEGWYDVLVTTVAGQDDYYLEGKVTFKPSVTVKA